MVRTTEVMREVIARADPAAKKLLREANKYLRRSFKAESPPHVAEFARLLGLTPSALSRRFSSLAGTSASTYFKDQQVECAKRLLRNTRYSVTRIGYRAAFRTRRTFYRAFRHRTGLTPGEYRMQQKREPAGVP